MWMCPWPLSRTILPDGTSLALLPQPSGRVLVKDARDRAGEQAAQWCAPSILSHEIKNPLAGYKGRGAIAGQNGGAKGVAAHQPYRDRGGPDCADY